MPFFDKLLHMFRRRPSGPGLKKTAAFNKRNDGKHFRAGTQFQNREQVGQVIPEDVTRCGDRILSGFGTFEGMVHRVYGSHGLNVQSTGVVILQVELNFCDDLGIVRPVLIQPENNRGFR